MVVRGFVLGNDRGGEVESSRVGGGGGGKLSSSFLPSGPPRS